MSTSFPSRISVFVTWTIRIGAVIWLLVHFALTSLYVAPENPITLSARPILLATIGRFFPQNWGLFAPNPISSNEILLVRCSGPDATSSSAHPPSDAWNDISSPFWRKFQKHRFSAYDRLERVAGNALREYLGMVRDGNPEFLAKQCKGGDASACALEARIRDQKLLSDKLLARIASSFCNSQEDAARSETASIRLRVSEPIAWIDRNRARAAKTIDYDIGTYPIDHHVAVATFYARGR